MYFDITKGQVAPSCIACHSMDWIDMASFICLLVCLTHPQFNYIKILSYLFFLFLFWQVLIFVLSLILVLIVLLGCLYGWWYVTYPYAFLYVNDMDILTNPHSCYMAFDLPVCYLDLRFEEENWRFKLSTNEELAADEENIYCLREEKKKEEKNTAVVPT